MLKNDLNILLNFIDSVQLDFDVRRVYFKCRDGYIETHMSLKGFYKDDFMKYFHSWYEKNSYSVKNFSLFDIDDEVCDYEFVLNYF